MAVNPAPFDWGFFNFGAVSILLATAMVAGWAFTCAGRIGFWVSLGLFLVLGIVLGHEYPTWGGIMGALAGSGYLALGAYSRASRLQTGAVIAAIFVMGAVVIFVPKNPAVSKKHGEEDTPFSSRLLIWKAAPHMLLDAPEGWDKSDAFGWDATGTGPAYMLGYQPFGEGFQEYRTLVSGHLTWLAEHDWVHRFLYVCAWALAGVIVWPAQNKRWLLVPAAIWITVGIAGLFSPALMAPVVWVFPAAALLFAAGFRVFTRTWPHPGQWLLVPAAVCGVFMLAIFSAAAIFPLQVPVHRDGDRVIIGYGEPSVWFIHPYVDVLGHHFGQGIRQIVISARDEGHPVSIGIARSLDAVNLKNEAGTIYVFSYKNISYGLPAHARRLIFLNTWLTPPAEWPPNRMGKKDMTILGAGMLNNNSDGRAVDKDRWKQIQAADTTFTLSVLDRTTYFLPLATWKEPILKAIKDQPRR